MYLCRWTPYCPDAGYCSPHLHSCLATPTVCCSNCLSGITYPYTQVLHLRNRQEITQRPFALQEVPPQPLLGSCKDANLPAHAIEQPLLNHLQWKSPSLWRHMRSLVITGTSRRCKHDLETPKVQKLNSVFFPKHFRHGSWLLSNSSCSVNISRMHSQTPPSSPHSHRRGMHDT